MLSNICHSDWLALCLKRQTGQAEFQFSQYSTFRQELKRKKKLKDDMCKNQVRIWVWQTWYSQVKTVIRCMHCQVFTSGWLFQIILWLVPHFTSHHMVKKYAPKLETSFKNIICLTGSGLWLKSRLCQMRCDFLYQKTIKFICVNQTKNIFDL